jgi:hypothetical protein
MPGDTACAKESPVFQASAWESASPRECPLPAAGASESETSAVWNDPILNSGRLFEAGDGIRTRDPLFTRQVLWPAELLRQRAPRVAVWLL